MARPVALAAKTVKANAGRIEGISAAWRDCDPPWSTASICGLGGRPRRNHPHGYQTLSRQFDHATRRPADLASQARPLVLYHQTVQSPWSASCHTGAGHRCVVSLPYMPEKRTPFRAARRGFSEYKSVAPIDRAAATCGIGRWPYRAHALLLVPTTT